jgi:hypothetical protein
MKYNLSFRIILPPPGTVHSSRPSSGKVPSFLHSFIPSFLHSFIPSFLHSFIPSFFHSFIPSFFILHSSFFHSSYFHSFILSFFILHSFILNSFILHSSFLFIESFGFTRILSLSVFTRTESFLFSLARSR